MSDSKNNVVITMARMEEARIASECATICDLFVKFGMPANISGSRARNDFKSYHAKAMAGELATYEPPTYVQTGLSRLLNPPKAKKARPPKKARWSRDSSRQFPSQRARSRGRPSQGHEMRA